MVAATHRPSEALSALLHVLREPSRRKDATAPTAEPAWALPSLVLWGAAADPKIEKRHRKAAVVLFLIGVRTK